MSAAIYFHTTLNTFVTLTVSKYEFARLYGTKDNIPYKPLFGRLTASYVRDTGPIKNWELAFYRRDTKFNHLDYARLLLRKYPCLVSSNNT